MRQFILAGNAAYADSLPVGEGKIAFTYLNNGVPTIDSDGSKLHKQIEGNIILGRPAGKAPVVLPFFNNHFTYVKGTYVAATTFVATLTIPTPAASSDYGIMIVVNGKKFNERNRWTAIVHTAATAPTATVLAGNLVNQINNNTSGHGIVATNSGAAITLTANTPGVDYTIIPIDTLSGTAVTYTAHGKPAYGDGNMILDLANKAAADAGYEYTYNDAEIYGGYPINKSQAAFNSGGYTIYTLRFAEPRKTAQLDKLVHQIVQIAFPTGASAISTIDTILAAISKDADNASAVSTLNTKVGNLETAVGMPYTDTDSLSTRVTAIENNP